MFKGFRFAVPLAVLAAAFVMTACAQPSTGQAGPAGVTFPASGSDGDSGSDGMVVEGESVTVTGEDGEDGGTSVGQSSSSSGADGSGSPAEVTTEEFSGVGRLEVSTATGQISVTGTDATAVSVTRSIYRGGNEPEETVRQQGDLLHIESGCTSSSGPCRIDYELSVPRGMAIAIEAASGDLSTSGLTGSQSVVSVSGSVTLFGVQGEQTVAESTSGDVEVQLVNQPVRLEASSVSGDVRVLVPDAGPYRVEGSTVTGDAEIGVPTDPAARSTIAVTTTSGDIMVGTG